MTDAYALPAEFYELLGREQAEPRLRVLRNVLAHVDVSTGSVLELGAGTGLATLAIAETLPGAEILALEPSRAMRAVLHSRLAERPHLRDNVTVLPLDFATAEPELPDRFCVVVGMSMLGHLDPMARNRLWRLLQARLQPSGIGVFELQAPERPEVIPETLYTRARQGGLAYEGTFSAEPSGPHTVDWTMRWRVYRGDHLIREHVGHFANWWTIGEADVLSETQQTGLRCEAAGEGLMTFRIRS